MANPPFKYGVPLIVIVLLVFFIFYVIMVYPTDRAKILLENKQEHQNKNVIYIKGGEFQPSEITISKGESVTWINQDNTNHRINGADFMSPIIYPGGSYTHKFTDEGTYVYSCEFHPEMSGKIIVKWQ